MSQRFNPSNKEYMEEKGVTKIITNTYETFGELTQNFNLLHKKLNKKNETQLCTEEWRRNKRENY